MYSVLIIDDSALMRKILKGIINSMEDFTVVCTAIDAYDAREKIKEYEPDLVTIDINMPKMNGITFLRNLMKFHPMPAVIISGEDTEGNEIFEYGAVGFIKKFEVGEKDNSFELRVKENLMRLIFLLKRYTLKKPKAKKKNIATSSVIEEKNHPDILLKNNPSLKKGKKIIAIGSSTGGIESLLRVFSTLPSNLPPIVMTQHIPYGFSSSFAKRLDKSSHHNIKVKEAENGDICEESCAYLAPGNMHMIIENTINGKYKIRLDNGVKISRHKPSVNILFRSINNCAGGGAMGILMTGMGDDGAMCLKEMRNNGAYTIAQDEKTSVVFGMPAKAIELNAAVKVIALNKIADEIKFFSSNKY
jgi:two-component system, chemotaxis family, protein-glutamate methylesterase/glutaminase